MLSEAPTPSGAVLGNERRDYLRGHFTFCNWQAPPPAVKLRIPVVGLTTIADNVSPEASLRG